MLPPAFPPAIARLLAVYNAWEPAAYHAMLSPDRPSIEEEERQELAGYLAKHGACTGYAPAEMIGAREARLLLTCERGPLEMVVSLDARGLITGFAGKAPSPPAPTCPVK